MKLDSLGRRLRNQPQPKGEGIVLTDRNRSVLAALRKHYVLPSSLLRYFWDENGSKYTFREVMTRMFHEEKSGGPFIVRPGELNPVPEDGGFNTQPAWVALSEAGFEIAQADRLCAPAPKRDSYHHRAMGGCISASLELLGPSYGSEWGGLDELLEHKDCPPEVRQAKNPLLFKVGDSFLEVDGVQRQRIIGHGFRFFTREEDRGGESFHRADKAQTTLQDKFEKYIEFFRRRVFEEVFGLPNPRVLFTTTRPGRIETCKQWLEGKPYADRFLFKSIRRFDTHYWNAPRQPLRELFEEPWDTVNGPFDLTKA